jgi:hypothetical protein
MKINRFAAMAALSLLVVGALGLVATRGFAKGVTAPVAQVQTCDTQGNDTNVVQGAVDTDNVDLQCGDQNAPDTGVAASGVQEIVSAANNINVVEQVGDQNTPTPVPGVAGSSTQEAVDTTDTDNTQDQVGNQSGPDTGIQTTDGQDTVDAADTDNIQEQVGDQSGPDTQVQPTEAAQP